MLKLKIPKLPKTLALLEDYDRRKFDRLLRGFGDRGVAALSAATPVDTNETANAWSYHLEQQSGRYKLIWTNSKMAGNVPVVVLLQYGHATRDGTYISGRDFINPALKPIIADINKALRAEVK